VQSQIQYELEADRKHGDQLGIRLMSFPFSFSGTINVPAQVAYRATVVSNFVVRALADAGAMDIDLQNDQIRFRGVTGKLTMGPLVNIERGYLMLRANRAAVDVEYDVAYERWVLFAGAALAPLFGIVAWSITGSFVLLGYGLIVGALSLGGFYWVRIRFRRWLAKTFDQSLARITALT
jgi:hypothetical protein